MDKGTLGKLGKSPVEKEIEKLIKEAEEEYFKEHGRYPKEDGIAIMINKNK